MVTITLKLDLVTLVWLVILILRVASANRKR